MLGPPKARHVDRPVLASLDDLVPPGHFYRHLEAALDLSFVRELVRDRYAAGGRPSVDPVVYFKLQLVMFFEGLRSEQKLVETASLHLAHRWYLGYALDEPLPDPSTLSRIRARLGVEVFRRFFERVVELCQEAGLVWGRELFFDATKVRANAAVGSVVPRLGRVVGDHIEALFPEGGDAQGAARRPADVATASDRGAPAPAADPGGAARPAPRRPRDWSPGPRGGTSWTRAASTRTARRVGVGLRPPLGPPGQPHRPGRRAHEHGRRRAGHGGVPGPLRGGRRAGAGHPARPGGPRRRDGGPAAAGLPLAGALPLEGAPAVGGGQLQVRYGGQHPRPGGRRHPRLRPAPQLRAPGQPLLPPGRLPV